MQEEKSNENHKLSPFYATVFFRFLVHLKTFDDSIKWISSAFES